MNAPLRTIKTAPQLPEFADFLFEPHPYKVLHGGRGAAKTKSIARALLIIGAETKKKILCCREIQDSIAESVHAQLKIEIEELGLGYFYTVTKNRIVGANGTEFLFAGLHMNVDKIKSIPDIDIVWIEEGQSVSADSYWKLDNTIRKAGSEVWISFNPELDSDIVYIVFVKRTPPEGAVVKEVGWRNNPWFHETTLPAKRLAALQGDEDDYLWIWEGKLRQFLEGSVYAKEIRAVTARGGIRKVPYDAATAVNVFLDLGWADLLTSWFVQKVGLEYRALAYKAGRRIKVGEFVAEVRRDHPDWNIDTWFLPHDAESAQLAADGGNTEDLFKAAGCKTQIIERIPSEDYGIRKVRDILPSVWFDEDGCADGITALRHYRFKVDEKTKEFSRTPKHDEASHGAKGFEGFAVSAGIDYSTPVVNLKPPTDYQMRFNTRGTGWMNRLG